MNDIEYEFSELQKWIKEKLKNAENKDDLRLYADIAIRLADIFKGLSNKGYNINDVTSFFAELFVKDYATPIGKHVRTDEEYENETFMKIYEYIYGIDAGIIKEEINAKVWTFDDWKKITEMLCTNVYMFMNMRSFIIKLGDKFKEEVEEYNMSNVRESEVSEE